MSYETHRTTKDCVPVALANFFGIPYDEAIGRLKEKGWVNQNKGVNLIYWFQVVQDLHMEMWGRQPVVCKPRRGAEKLTGLVQLKKGSQGHLTVLIEGMICDTDGLIKPLTTYRAAGWHVRMVVT